MAEQVRLMLSPQRLNVRGTVKGSDTLARRYCLMGKCDKADFVYTLSSVCLRPRSDRGETHKLSLFGQTRDHFQKFGEREQQSGGVVLGGVLFLFPASALCCSSQGGVLVGRRKI